MPSANPTAPDGGFGWVVCFAAFMQHVISLGISYSIGVYYPYLIDTFKVAPSTAAWVAALHLCLLYGIGPACGWLVEKIGTSWVSFLGSIVAGIGCIGAAYSTSIYLIIFCLGFVSGSGAGLMFLSSVTAVSRWFDTKRALATGLAVSGAGFGIFVFAPLVRLLLTEFGGEGALLIEGGLAFQGCVFALLLRPVPSGVQRRRNQVQGAATPNFREKRIFSAVSEEITPLDANQQIPIKPAPTVATVMRGWKFWLFGLNQFLAFLCASGPLVFLYNRAVSDLSIEIMEAAYVISMMGVANTAGRLMFGALGNKFPRSRLYLLSGAIITFGLATSASTLGMSFWSISLFAIVFGSCYGCMFALSSVVLVDQFGLALLGPIYGNLGVFKALACIMGPPFGGWMITFTGNSHSALFILNGLLGFAGGMVLLVIPLVDRLKARKQNSDIIQHEI